MQSHRSTQRTVSKDAENDNFDAGTALENLRAEVVDIEALARAAEAAAEALPTPANDRQRVVFGRILSLATKTSEQASASLRFRERADHRAHRAEGGTPEGGGPLSDAVAGAAWGGRGHRRWRHAGRRIAEVLAHMTCTGCAIGAVGRLGPRGAVAAR